VSLPGLRGGRGRRLALLLTAAACVGVLGQPSAGAASRPTIEQVRDQVDALHDQAEAATEKYNQTREKIAALQLQVTAAQTKVAQQQKAVSQAQIDLGRIAVDSYKAGDLATLSLFFNDDPDKYLSTNGLFISLSDRRLAAVEALTKQRQDLVGGMTDVQDQQQRLQQAQKDLQTNRTLVLAKLADATALLGQLTDDERARLGQLRAGHDRTSLADLGITVPASGRLTCADVPIAMPAGKVGKVLAYACAQVGDPYRWGAEGPSTFDCSGLTLMAWRAGGVSLPRTAADQADAGTRVTRSQLQPGDLVFFHSPISHVALYIGNGLMLHAPQTGDVVKIVPLRTDGLVAAVRF